MSESKIIEIETRIGKRSIDLDKVIDFPRGLPGFEGLHKFILLQIENNPAMMILQSIESSHIGLLVADPYSYLPDYTYRISEAEQKFIGLENTEELKSKIVALITVSIPVGQPENTTFNLLGPILINQEKRIGLQAPQMDNGKYSSMRLKDIMDNTQE